MPCQRYNSVLDDVDDGRRMIDGVQHDPLSASLCALCVGPWLRLRIVCEQPSCADARPGAPAPPLRCECWLSLHHLPHLSLSSLPPPLAHVYVNTRTHTASLSAQNSVLDFIAYCTFRAPRRLRYIRSYPLPL